MREAPQTRAVSAVVQRPATGRSSSSAQPTSARIEDPLPWDDLAGCDAAYFTGHDSATLAAARRARALVVTSRRLPSSSRAACAPTCSIASATDPSEAVDPRQLPVPPGAIVWTEGGEGGRYLLRRRHRRALAAPRPCPALRSTATAAATRSPPGSPWAWARGLDLDEALALGARCGAACLTGRGALGPQLVEARASGRAR